ncbi:heme lyase CcmF/NrfE family subunit [Gilvimarinus sp. F26214L]|uniref:heme lyase CcmF/NrfE family subunit n=1 Tax=Gilvimarinus sp. DZF01 TaxID=3461371 RepID=UPI0040454594
MVPELGHFALIMSLCLAIGAAVLPMVGSYTNNLALMQSGRSMAVGLFVFAFVSFLCLVWAFTHDDFSVAYVASNSNTLLPLHYKLTATWGGHEGSLLLWILMMAGWLLAVTFFARSLPRVIHARVLSIMAMTVVGIMLFTVFTSNPFERILPGSPAEGSDLNPLLQDFGFIVHPPMLYLGYSGFSVAFAFAITALLSGHLDSAWARWSRPWTNVSWGFLTLGIGLGSWWAYYELGWGFWWGWDPTENNSLIPWLTATALVHSLAVTEKRGLFKTWTILLAIATFCLILLGTFITRSGVVNSVHAFANDPERGAFLLLYMGVVAFFSLLLYALKAPNVASLSAFRLSSRESFMLANNILLTILMATVFLGTIYPMISDGFGWGKVSVGAPYFNFFWVLLVVPICLLMGASALSQWKQTSMEVYRKYLKLPVLISLVIALVFPFLYSDEYRFGGAVTLFVVLWIVTSTAAAVLRQTRNAPNLWKGLRQLKMSYYSMVVAHIGVAVLALGAGLTSVYSEERNLILVPGSSKELFGYQWGFSGVQEVRGPNYFAQEGEITVSKGDKLLATLHPEKRFYMSGAMVTTEAAIQGNLWRDLYVSLGEATEPKAAGGWVVTVYVKPFIAWLWMGITLMAAGGLMALFDKRYRHAKVADKVRTRRRTASAQVTAGQAG